MKRILIAAIAAGALFQAGVASAGCMATVGLAAPPQGIAPGTTWSAEITVLQHGVRPLPNAKTAQPDAHDREHRDRQAEDLRRPADERSGRLRRERCVPGRRNLALRGLRRLHERGRGARAVRADAYVRGRRHRRARGRWESDASELRRAGAGAARSHTTSADDGSFPVWPVVGAVLAGLAAIVASLLLLRRRRGRPEVVAH